MDESNTCLHGKREKRKAKKCPEGKEKSVGAGGEMQILKGGSGVVRCQGSHLTMVPMAGVPQPPRSFSWIQIRSENYSHLACWHQNWQWRPAMSKEHRCRRLPKRLLVPPSSDLEAALGRQKRPLPWSLPAWVRAQWYGHWAWSQKGLSPLVMNSH